MIPRPPLHTRNYTIFPYPTLFRSSGARAIADKTVVEGDDTGAFFNIKFYAESAQAAREGADAVREVYLARMLEMRRQRDLQRLDALRHEGARVAAALDLATRRKRAFERENGINL